MSSLEPSDSACCTDCRCTERSDLLGLDSSYLFILARAINLAGETGTFLEGLISAHTCNSQRELVLSSKCHDECFLPAAPTGGGLGDRPVLTELIPDLDRVALLNYISIVDCTPEMVASIIPVEVDGQHRELDPGELSLLAVIETFERQGWIAIEDDDAFTILLEMVVQSLSNVMPIATLRFWRELYNCFAISSANAVLLCTGFEEDLNTRRLNMSAHKANRKRTDLSELINHIALTDLERSTG